MILKYSKGRTEMLFTNNAFVELKDIAKVTISKNGDYKLVYYDQVYFWC